MDKEIFDRICSILKAITTSDSDQQLHNLQLALAVSKKNEDINTMRIKNCNLTLLEYAIGLYLAHSLHSKIADSLYKAIDLLLQNQASASIYGGRIPPLHEIVTYHGGNNTSISSYEPIKKILKLFYDHKADFSIKDSSGNTLLHSAVNKRNYNLIYILQDYGCGLNCLNKGLSGSPQTTLDILNEKAEHDVNAREFMTEVKEMGALTCREISGITNTTGRFDVKKQQYAISFKDIESARMSGKLADLFNDAPTRTFIQSNFDYRSIRAWLADVDKVNNKNAASLNEAEIPTERIKFSFFSKSNEKHKKPTERELILKIKSSCMLNKEHMFNENMDALYVTLRSQEKIDKKLKQMRFHQTKHQLVFEKFMAQWKQHHPEDVVAKNNNYCNIL